MLFRHVRISSSRSSFIILLDSSPFELSFSDLFVIHGCELFLLKVSTFSNPSTIHRPPSLFLYQLNNQVVRTLLAHLEKLIKVLLPVSASSPSTSSAFHEFCLVLAIKVCDSRETRYVQILTNNKHNIK